MKLGNFIGICLIFCFEAKEFSSISVEKSNYAVKESEQKNTITYSSKNNRSSPSSLNNRVIVQNTPLVKKSRKIINLVVQEENLNRRGKKKILL